MFIPPRCPNPGCQQHVQPTTGFFRRRGFYYPASRDQGVPRFLCRTCHRSFSSQTFRYDYRDRRPWDNDKLFWLLVSGVGLRQAGRWLKMDIRAVQQKKHKLARHCADLHQNCSPRLPAGRSWLLDEEETYEGASIRPLTMPVLIDRETWFVVATAVGSIRRLAAVGSARRWRQDLDERHGPRPDRSRECVERVLRALASKVADGAITLHTDQKASYAALAKGIFGDRVVHTTTAGTLVRDTHNPLFPINTTLAMTRDNCGRLRRRSWLITKRADCLQDHMHIFTVYRNYVRRRFNRDKEVDTAAKLLRLMPRNLRVHELLAWRQDWGHRSIHPMSTCGSRTIRESMSA